MCDKNLDGEATSLHVHQHPPPDDAQVAKRQRNLQAQRRCQAKQKVCDTGHHKAYHHLLNQAQMHSLQNQKDALQAELERLRAAHTALVRQGQLLQQRMCVEDERLVDAQRCCFRACHSAWFDAGTALPLVTIDHDGAVRLGTTRLRLQADAAKMQSFATTEHEVCACIW